MRAELHFDLPEERGAFDASLQGPQWRAVVMTLLEDVRHLVKYEDKEAVSLVELRELIHRLVVEHRLRIE